MIASAALTLQMTMHLRQRCIEGAVLGPQVLGGQQSFSVHERWASVKAAAMAIAPLIPVPATKQTTVL